MAGTRQFGEAISLHPLPPKPLFDEISQDFAKNIRELDAI
jgi:hypothetical protein